MANVPLGSIATPVGVENWAFVPTPSREPRALPANV
tara:strand:- start:1130 stop:1237 length:108 start_codon:yes stop_codon:yes gene_type:complete